MLRILMTEHFRKHCREGQIYSLHGSLPAARLLQESLRPKRSTSQKPSAATPTLTPTPMFASADPEPEILNPTLGRSSDVPHSQDAVAAVVAFEEPTTFVQVVKSNPSDLARVKTGDAFAKQIGHLDVAVVVHEAWLSGSLIPQRWIRSKVPSQFP